MQGPVFVAALVGCVGLGVVGVVGVAVPAVVVTPGADHRGRDFAGVVAVVDLVVVVIDGWR